MPLKNGRIKTAVQIINVDLSVPSSIQLSSLNIDWNSGYVYNKDISASSIVSFSNVVDGKMITIILKNTSTSTITLTMPSGLYKPSYLDLSIEAGKENIYTFISSNNKIYVSGISKFTNT